MQKWEYHVFHRQREVADGLVTGWDENVVGQLPQLGEEGWELVTILPRSSVGNGNEGITTDELWIFKRPKVTVTSGGLQP
jgi:hypothetical protein